MTASPEGMAFLVVSSEVVEEYEHAHSDIT